MDFFDEDSIRPRLVFQSKQLSSSSLDQQQQDQLLQNQKPTKLFLFFTITISSILLISSFLYFKTEPFQSLVFWVSLAFLIGPFAPSDITGGNVRVGHGSIIESEEPIADEADKIQSEPKRKTIHKRPNSNPGIRSESSPFPVIESNGVGLNLGINREKNDVVSKEKGSVELVEETDWTDEDFEMLKKQIAKNPVGKPKRWEVIAEAFKGRHRMESVIKKAKEMGDRKSDDDYALFLKNRKPMDRKSEGEIETKSEIESKNENGANGGWSSGEDIALLNALKVFTKDVPMRWEKISASVPGKTKSACMKRVAELKKGFRSSKANASEN
ncbi:transcription factor MAMYB [Rutidosis leptorrhynchoides]|uniref:transcription factor MAMYB n=1 Tax=Rutidosis leptorrhynchoides TaxID=125765 RepID=UPI003A99B952